MGRPPSSKTLVDRQLGRNRPNILPAGESYIVPNYSGVKDTLLRNDMSYKSKGVVIVSNTVTNTTDETIIANIEFTKNELNVSSVIKATGNGEITTVSASDAVTFRVKLGGLTIAENVMVAKVATNDPWDTEGILTIREIGTSGIASIHVDATIADTTSHDNNNNVAVDTTTAKTLQITVQWNNAKAGNIFRFDQGIVELIN